MEECLKTVLLRQSDAGQSRHNTALADENRRPKRAGRAANGKQSSVFSFQLRRMADAAAI
jgi:hypothetical protein